MKINAKALAFILIFAFAAPFAFSADFGLILDQGFTLADHDYLSYSVMALPWFAAPLGEKADVYLSGGAGGEYEYGGWRPLYEVYRFELNWYLADGLRFSFGRQSFHDSLGLAMSGLFDGISATIYAGGGILNMGVFYTGLLYKKSASITLSANDQNSYNNSDSYFASRRLAGGVNWEKTSIFDSSTNFWLSGIYQVDLNDADVKIHSQYLAAKFGFPLGASGNLDLGAMAELAEETNKDPRAAFAAVADVQWLFAGGRTLSMLSAGGRFSSGGWADGIAVFTPLTGMSMGKVLRPNLSGIALLQADYVLRVPGGLFLEFYSACLFRTDKAFFDAPGIDASSDSSLLGGEVYLGCSWSPLSDLIFTLGGGVFLPGKAFDDSTAIKYRLEITAGISL